MRKFFLILFLLLPLQANAEITAGDILFFPLRVITKPIIWAFYGFEYKSGNYNVEITYNLELDGKPLKITNAINCQIYEGSARSLGDGIKRPSRRVVENTRQITHYLEETNEILILPVPGYCEVDAPYLEEEITDPKTNKKEIKITAVENKTKSFAKFTDQMVMSFAFAKLDKNNENKVTRIERVVSPKYYEMPNARIRLKSYEFTTETNLEAIDSKIANRFAWINGESLDPSRATWGTYKAEDKGAYMNFGVFKYPKEIWSRIPVINDFVTKIVKDNPKENLIYVGEKDKGYEELEMVFENIKHYLRDTNVNRFFGRLGIGEKDDNSLSRGIGYYEKLFENKKKAWEVSGPGWTLIPSKEKQFKEIAKISNFRDYYHPFIFHQDINEWVEYEGGEHLLVLERARNPQSVIIEDLKGTGIYIWSSHFEFNGIYYKINSSSIIYNKSTNELIIPSANSATFLN